MYDRDTEYMFCFLTDTRPMWRGADTQCTLSNLSPNTVYSFKLRASTEGDDSPLSEVAMVTTDETGIEKSYWSEVRIFWA